MDAIDKVVQLTSLETLRLISPQEPTIEEVKSIRRALTSYYEDHCWLYGVREAQYPISYKFLHQGRDGFFDSFMNSLMRNLILRPSCYTQCEGFKIITELYWYREDYELPRVPTENLLRLFKHGHTDPLYRTLNPFSKWVCKEELRRV